MSSRADRFMWAKGDCTVIMPRGSVTEEAQDEFSEEMHPRDDRGRFGGGSNEQGRSHAAGEAGRGELAGQHFREGSKFPITVEGVHYSGQAGLKELDPGKYGSAHPGAEFKRIQQMEPGKLRDELMRRSYLYAGENPKPEGVLGGVHNAYAAKLTNIYDGAKDPEHLRETCKNGNEWERAVIDHHYDGYLAPSPGSHGSVVLLGTPAVKVSPVHAGAHDQRCSITEDGEGAGHAFHGNQHTGGTGRVMHEAVKKPAGVPEHGSVEYLREVITDEAAKQGVPMSKVSFDPTDEKFDVGDQKNFEEAGHFDPQTGGIVIRETGMKDTPPEQMRETMSHECGHMFFQQALDNMNGQVDRFKAIQKELAVNEKPKTGAEMLAREKLEAEKEAIAKDIQKNGIFSMFNDNNMEMLKREDGVSDYSTAYWKATGKETDEQARESGSRLAAMHETFAEIHAHLSMTDKPKSELAALKARKPRWWNVYKDVMAVHKSLDAAGAKK